MVSRGTDTPVGETGEGAPTAESYTDVERTAQVGIGRSTAGKRKEILGETCPGEGLRSMPNRLLVL